MGKRFDKAAVMRAMAGFQNAWQRALERYNAQPQLGKVFPTLRWSEPKRAQVDTKRAEECEDACPHHGKMRAKMRRRAEAHARQQAGVLIHRYLLGHGSPMPWRRRIARLSLSTHGTTDRIVVLDRASV